MYMLKKIYFYYIKIYQQLSNILMDQKDIKWQEWALFDKTWP